MADEQWLAWLQAIREDAEPASARNSAVDSVDPEAALVYVRKRRQLSPGKSGRRDV
jgi:hypothetical protein